MSLAFVILILRLKEKPHLLVFARRTCQLYDPKADAAVFFDDGSQLTTKFAVNFRVSITLKDGRI
jgi:hypothetical protein